MRIIILTSTLSGTAAHHLPYLVNNKNIEIALVVYCKRKTLNKKKYYKRKISKMFKIGILGTLNGIRMRKWFNRYVSEYIEFHNIIAVCDEHKIPVRMVDTINSQETISIFKDAQADVGISLGNGYISSKVYSIPKYGMINIHHELLPEYQNAPSVIWQIYNKSKYTGYTIHKIDKKIDAGDILYREKIPITFKESLPRTVAATKAQLYEHSVQGLNTVLSDFDKYYSRAISQGNGSQYTTPSLSQYIRILKNHSILKK